MPATNNAHLSPVSRPIVSQLLAFQDKAFVHQAYRSLLGRDSDPEGFEYYLARLRVGYSKIHLLMQLRGSAEAKNRTAGIEGLDKAIRQYQRGQWPIVGWLFRLIEKTEGNALPERRIRSLENKLFLLEADAERRIRALESKLSLLQADLGKQLGMVNKNLALTEAAALKGSTLVSSESGSQAVPLNEHETIGLPVQGESQESDHHIARIKLIAALAKSVAQ